MATCRASDGRPGRCTVSCEPFLGLARILGQLGHLSREAGPLPYPGKLHVVPGAVGLRLAAQYLALVGHSRRIKASGSAIERFGANLVVPMGGLNLQLDLGRRVSAAEHSRL